MQQTQTMNVHPVDWAKLSAVRHNRLKRGECQLMENKWGRGEVDDFLIRSPPHPAHQGNYNTSEGLDNEILLTMYLPWIHMIKSTFHDQ